jgi:tetratricopeptide (TPR) repeat protein
MPRERLSMQFPRRHGLWALVLTSAGALFFVGPGCADSDKDAGRDLDSTLVRAERLLDAGSVLDARQELLGSLDAAPGGWKGMQAAGAYRLLGELSEQTAQLDSALLFYGRAEESYRGLAQRHEAFNMSRTILGIHRLMEQEEDARVGGTEALRLATLLGDSGAVQDIRWALLEVYGALEQPREMERIAAALRAFCRRSGDLAGEARIDYILGTSEAQRRQSDAAIGSLLQSISVAGKAKDPALVLRSLLSLAATFEQMGRVREAQESYATILQRSDLSGIEPALRFRTFMRIGNFHFRNRRPDSASAYFQKASTLAQGVSNAVGEAYALMQQGYCERGRSRGESELLFHQGYELFQQVGFAQGNAYALVSIGYMAEQENKVTDAVQFYRAAVKQQESAYAHRQTDDLWLDCEESVLGRGGVDSHGALISLLLQMGKADDAFWYQERRNARLLSDDLSAWNVVTGVPATDSLVHNYAHRRALHMGAERILEQLGSSPRGSAPLLGRVRAELDRLQEEITAQAERVRHGDPRLTAVVDADGMSVAEVQKALDEDATLLMYVPTPRSLYVCAVTPSRSVTYLSAMSQERVTDLIERYLQECTFRTVTADSAQRSGRGQDVQMRELTGALYEAMVLPVESILRPNTRLLIVPPSRLPAFSLAGLRRGGGTGAPALGERCSVSYLPTARFLLAQTAAPSPIRTVTALGVRGSTAWDVEYELRDIHAFYREARLLFGREAALASLRSVRDDLLHLSIEVRFKVQRPLSGECIFGDGATIDGTTPASLGALFGVPPVPAVVLFNLSSRQPATDRALAAAFLSNGSASVILSAAPLTRKAKKVFGEGFYTALESGEQVPAAQRAAQNAMARSRDLSAPHFWAPVMLWGKGGGGEKRMP